MLPRMENAPLNSSLHRAAAGAAVPRARPTYLMALLPGALLVALAFFAVDAGLQRTVLLGAAAFTGAVGLYAIRGSQRLGFEQAMEAFARGDYAVAVKPLRTLAQRGDVRAQTNLGFMYAAGRGVRRDERLAVRWYLQAARRGYAPAQYNLAHMYADGRGCERSAQEAMRWYQQAAGADFAPALRSLGHVHETGRGVRPNKDAAVGWYYKAGLQFLRDDDPTEAQAMLRAIERLSVRHPHAQLLRAAIEA